MRADKLARRLDKRRQDRQSDSLAYQAVLLVDQVDGELSQHEQVLAARLHAVRRQHELGQPLLQEVGVQVGQGVQLADDRVELGVEGVGLVVLVVVGEADAEELVEDGEQADKVGAAGVGPRGRREQHQELVVAGVDEVELIACPGGRCCGGCLKINCCQTSGTRSRDSCLSSTRLTGSLQRCYITLIRCRKSDFPE